MTETPQTYVPPTNPDQLLSRAEVSAYLKSFGLKLAPQTLAKWKSTGAAGPPITYFGHRALYNFAELNSWLNSQFRKEINKRSAEKERYAQLSADDILEDAQ